MALCFANAHALRTSKRRANDIERAMKRCKTAHIKKNVQADNCIRHSSFFSSFGFEHRGGSLAHSFLLFTFFGSDLVVSLKTSGCDPRFDTFLMLPIWFSCLKLRDRTNLPKWTVGSPGFVADVIMSSSFSQVMLNQPGHRTFLDSMAHSSVG
jgi:hypothetical protein